MHFVLSASTLRLARVVFAILGLTTSAICLHAQAKPTASRAGDLQVGATFSLASPDYGPNTLRGVGAYATFDFRPHLGIEANFRQLNDPDGREGIYERNFEVGPRYVFHIGPLSPYAKLMIGRGTFQFPPDPRNPEKGSVANLAYTMWRVGSVRITVSVRRSMFANYELQRWVNFRRMAYPRTSSVWESHIASTRFVDTAPT